MRTPTVTMSALIAGLAFSLVALGSDAAGHAGDVGAANPSTTVAETAATPAPRTTGADDDPTEAEAPATPAGALLGALPPAATTADFEAAITAMHGPTTDAAGVLAPFVTPLPGIPTPEGADVDDFDLYLYPNAESPEYSYYSASVRFTATAPAAELVTFFQHGMPAAGFVHKGDSVRNRDDRQVRSLTYDVPDPTSPRDEVTITIVDDPNGDSVQLDITHGLDPASIDIFDGWARDLPLVATAELDGARVTTFSFGGRVSVTVSTDYDVALPKAEAIAQFEGDLAGTRYTLDPSSNRAEGSFQLSGGDFDSTMAYIGDGYPVGTSYLSITGSFDITP